jgi:DNA-directed RNA polymerase subunit F
MAVIVVRIIFQSRKSVLEKADEILDVSDDTQRARFVLKNGCAELVKAVEQKIITVSEARGIAKNIGGKIK